MSDKLIQTFVHEANELILDIEKSLLTIKENGEVGESVSEIFRAMHTLKGAAGMFGYQLIHTITHHLENIYQSIRDGSRQLDEQTIAITFRTVDQLSVLLNAKTPNERSDEYDGLLAEIGALDQTTVHGIQPVEIPSTMCTYYVQVANKPNALLNGTNPLYLIDDLLALGSGVAFPYFIDLPSLADLDAGQCYMSFEVVVATDRPEDEIRSVFLFAEGDCVVEVKKLCEGHMLSAWSTETNPFAERNIASPIGFEPIQAILSKKNARSVSGANNSKSKFTNIRVDSDRLDELMNLVSELVTTQARLSLFVGQNASGELSGIAENVEKITRRLRDNTFAMTLVPLDSLAVRFQRLVNDLSQELGKEIVLETAGLDTKVDKSIIERLTDPILHVLRNCIDHGIEAGSERLLRGKPAKGVITFRSYYSGASVVIEITDDGAGIDLGRVKAKARAQGLISADAELTEKELMELIFLPGFSTAEKITGVSGRGVGMDVVKRNINDIRGDIRIITSAGKGTSFIITLPLTLSIMDGLLVKIGKTDFILPQSSVVKCYEVRTNDLEGTFNQWVTLDQKRIPFFNLRNEFSINENTPFYSQVVTLRYEGKMIGVVVDRIVGEYQAVLKPLGKFYNEQDEFSGATILGDGTVALVLDTGRMIRKLSA